MATVPPAPFGSKWGGNGTEKPKLKIASTGRKNGEHLIGAYKAIHGYPWISRTWIYPPLP